MSGIVLGKVIGNPGGAAVKVALNPDEFKAEIQLFLQAFRHADMHNRNSPDFLCGKYRLKDVMTGKHPRVASNYSQLPPKPQSLWKKLSN